MKRVQKEEFTPTPRELALLQQMRRLDIKGQEFLDRMVPQMLSHYEKAVPTLRLIRGGMA